MKTSVTTLDAAKAGDIELADAIFGLDPRPDLIHRMVRYQTLKRMAGTHHAQDRSGFARGALVAARWVVGRPPAQYSMPAVPGL